MSALSGINCFFKVGVFVFRVHVCMFDCERARGFFFFLHLFTFLVHFAARLYRSVCAHSLLSCNQIAFSALTNFPIPVFDVNYQIL